MQPGKRHNPFFETDYRGIISDGYSNIFRHYYAECRIFTRHTETLIKSQSTHATGMNQDDIDDAVNEIAKGEY